jgi:hypothetical protein
MIVDAFTESLEIGLESPGQVVVSAVQRSLFTSPCIVSTHP